MMALFTVYKSQSIKSVNQDQTVFSVLTDLHLHCQIKVSSSIQNTESVESPLYVNTYVLHIYYVDLISHHKKKFWTKKYVFCTKHTELYPVFLVFAAPKKTLLAKIKMLITFFNLHLQIY